MTLTTHAIVGAAIASVIPEYPALALCAAFASHFVVDAIPHWDYEIQSASIDPRRGARMKYDEAFFGDVGRIGVDVLLGILLSLLFFASSQHFWIILLGACAGILPDPLQFVYAHFRHEPLISLQRFHHWVHTTIRMKNMPVLGVVSQVAFVFAVVLCAKFVL